MREEVTNYNAGIIANELNIKDFVQGPNFYDFTMFYKIEEDDIDSVDSAFPSIKSQFLTQKICDDTKFNYYCPDSIVNYNIKDALFL